MAQLVVSNERRPAATTSGNTAFMWLNATDGFCGRATNDFACERHVAEQRSELGAEALRAAGTTSPWCNLM